MGFMLNGFGTTDKAKKSLYIGNYYCNTCKQLRDFYIYEQTKKIALLFIPTATINKKHGLFCEKCQCGYQISEGECENIYAGNLKSISQYLKVPITPTPQVSAATEVTQSDGLNQCPSCKETVKNDTIFCNNCGTRLG